MKPVKRYKINFLVFLLLAFVFISGCHASYGKDVVVVRTEETDSAGMSNSKGILYDNRRIVIAICPKAIDNPIFLDAKTAGEQAGQELGINIQWIGPMTSNITEQVAVIEGLIEKKVDAMLISCNDAEALKEVINKAVDSGIYVATFDSDSPNSKRMFYIGTNNYQAGMAAAQSMKKLLPQGGNIALLTGILGAPNLEERIQGFRDGIKGTNIKIVSIQSGEDDVSKSVEAVNQYTFANPDLNGWWFVGGWPFFTDEKALYALKDFRKKGGKVVSIDTFYPMLKYVQMDMVDQLIGSDYTKMGDTGVRLLYDAVMGKPVEENYIDTGFEFCDKYNVEEILKNKTPW